MFTEQFIRLAHEIHSVIPKNVDLRNVTFLILFRRSRNSGFAEQLLKHYDIDFRIVLLNRMYITAPSFIPRHFP